MRESDIILTPIPQADGRIKNRPALYLRELSPFRDLLVCGISAQIHQAVQDFDEIITINDDDFTNSGLVAESVIRLGFLAVLPRKKVIGSIGSISSDRHTILLKRLSNYLIKEL